ncbi:MAG: dihydroorotate dehydrogenase electron transfer subunit [Bacillota bacterium]
MLTGVMFRAAVLGNRDEGDAAHLVLEPDAEFEPAPGQFVHVRPAMTPGTDPLLRRPFSVSDWEADAGRMHLIIRPVGRVSQQLAQMTPGDVLDCIGPLGRGFPLPADAGGRAILIAGGVGAAPMIFLARQLCAAGCAPRVFLGARTRDQLIGSDLLEATGASVHISTDDGSAGDRGPVTGAVSRHLREEGESDVVYACGPRPMLAEVARLFPTADAYGSFEEFMACGVGACRGCSIALMDTGCRVRYARVCRDGPIFPLWEVHFGCPT